MATKAVLTAVALCLCVQFSFADDFVWLTAEESKVYSVMCTNKTGYKSVPMPPDHCDVGKYIGCRNGNAETIIECPDGKIFNRTKLWCEPAVNVTRPPGCPAVPRVKPYPLTCEEATQLPVTVPVLETCKMYKQCNHAGNYVMNCQDLAFYYPPKKDCVSLQWPYSVEMTQDFIAKCNELDPYELP